MSTIQIADREAGRSIAIVGLLRQHERLLRHLEGGPGAGVTMIFARSAAWNPANGPDTTPQQILPAPSRVDARGRVTDAYFVRRGIPPAPRGRGTRV